MSGARSCRESSPVSCIPQAVSASSVRTWLIVEDPRAGKVARVNTLQAMGPPAGIEPSARRVLTRMCGSSKRRVCPATRSHSSRGVLASRATSSSPGRRLMAQGALTAAGAGEEVVPASELRAAHQQIRELQRLLGKKTLENEILREAVERVTAPKKLPLRVTSWPGERPVSAVAA